MEFGFKEDGSYVTPYENTIYYDDAVLFDTVLAKTAHAQIVPLGARVDTLAETCEYVTPRLFMLSSHFDRPQLDDFLKRGFQKIYVCVDNVQQQDESTASAVVECDRSFIVHQTGLIGSVSASLVLDYLACQSSSHVPVFKGVDFDGYISLLEGVGENPERKLLQCCRGNRGLQMLDEYILAGKVLAGLKESMLDKAAERGRMVNWQGIDALLLENVEVTRDMLVKHAKAGLVEYCMQIRAVFQGTFATELTLFNISGSQGALEVLKKVSSDVSGDQQSAVAIIKS
jgi:hypothetical protein